MSATPTSASTAISARRACSSTTTGRTRGRTTIGSHVRTGSDTMFVAPVTVGDGAYTGAGTVVREDVPPGALAVSAGPQRNIEGWVARKRPGSAAAAAAAAAPRPPARRRRGRRRREPVAAVVRQPGHAATYVRLGRYRSPSGEGTVGTEWTDNRKNLMLFSGRAHPELAEQVAKELDVPGHRADRTRLRQRRDLRPLRRVGPRLRRVRPAVASGAAEPVADGTADHDRCAQARQRQADHRDPAVLSLCPAGQEAPRPRADLGATGRRSAQDRGRRPDPHRRPAHRPDPGLLRRPGRPHAGAEPADRLHRRELHRPRHGRGVPRLGSRARRREMGRRAGRRAPGVHPQDPRPAGAQPGEVQPRRRRRRRARPAC